MNNIVLTDDQTLALRAVLDYVMHAELDFFQDELASFGDKDARKCVGYVAYKLASELGMSSSHYDMEYNRSAAEFGFEEDNILDNGDYV